jgi:hypothetical protein
MLKKIIILIILASCFLHSRGQSPVCVFSSSRQEFKFPWAGGMNSCQFGKIDLNLDGTTDLVVFDRTGDRIMPFLAVQSGDVFDYEYAPGYAEKFPELYHWAEFVDYDLDGKADIFTYSPGYAGLKVYKNISDTELKFELVVYPYLKSFQGGGYVNILVTYADYPAIVDLDGDGDLDILTFYGLGAFVEKHRNMSMEKYGNADSLDYVKTESCWGFFAEGLESNILTLDTCMRCFTENTSVNEAAKDVGRRAWNSDTPTTGRRPPTADRRPPTANRQPPTADRQPRHTGSTFRVLDLNGDGLPDLLLGDVSYPNLVALYNGGNIDTARMTSYTWQYPPGKAVSLFSMPAAFYDDFDFDGIKDLLVSPFDPNPFLNSNFQSNWLYHNNGSDDQPQFVLKTRSFLQDQMIDLGAGAYPTFCDIDKDGLEDLLVGNYGYYDTSYFDQYMILHTVQTGQLAWLKNTGTADHPAFTFMDRDFAHTSELGLTGLVSAFGDLDGDGDLDMILGCENGQIILYLNTANPGEPVSLELSDLNYQGIDIGSYSAPQLFDLDLDGLADLIIGEKGGNLNYYRNSGSLQKPAFTLVTDSLGKVNVTDPSVSLDGFSVPFFYRDKLNQTHLLVGSEQGVVYYYTEIDDNLTGKFALSDTLAGLIGLQSLNANRGYRSAPALFDLDQNGFPELIAGNFSGGLEYFGRNTGLPVSRVLNPGLSDNLVKVFPSPAHDVLTIEFKESKADEPADLFLYDNRGTLIFRTSGNINEKIKLNVASFPGGIYLLKIIFYRNHSETSYLCRKIILL